MDGQSNAEIARRLGVIEKTVERKLRLIRQTWCREGPT
jgi:DNA-binding NarL/FixJ family response regulator